MWKKLPLTFSHLPIHIVTFFMSTFHTDRLFNEYREGLKGSQYCSSFFRVFWSLLSEIVVLQYSKNILLMHNVVFNSILEGIKSFESCTHTYLLHLYPPPLPVHLLHPHPATKKKIYPSLLE